MQARKQWNHIIIKNINVEKISCKHLNKQNTTGKDLEGVNDIINKCDIINLNISNFLQLILLNIFSSKH